MNLKIVSRDKYGMWIICLHLMRRTMTRRKRILNHLVSPILKLKLIMPLL